MSTSYNQYVAFIPASVVLEVGKDILHFCFGKDLEWSREGVTFKVEGYEEEWEAFEECDYNSDEKSHMIFMTLMRNLIRDGKISLTFLYHFDSGDDGDSWMDIPDWEGVLESCPTLVLRELLAKRLE